MSTANNFLIGADPEFAVLDANGRYMQVSLPQGKLGTDHSDRVVELRPDPSLTAEGLLEDIRRTLNRHELVAYRPYKWKAGAIAGANDSYVALGGHIHFDVPYSPDTTFTANCLRALNRVASWFDGLEFFPKGEAVLRQRMGYGNLGDARPAGRRGDGLPRLEYRTPPSWLYSPETTRLALTTFKLALVDPQHTLDALSNSDKIPMTKLRRFIGGFANTDSDAAIITQMIVADENRLRKFRGDPQADMKAAWNIPQA